MIVLDGVTYLAGVIGLGIMLYALSVLMDIFMINYKMTRDMRNQVERITVDDNSNTPSNTLQLEGSLTNTDDILEAYGLEEVKTGSSPYPTSAPDPITEPAPLNVSLTSRAGRAHYIDDRKTK